MDVVAGYERVVILDVVIISELQFINTVARWRSSYIIYSDVWLSIIIRRDVCSNLLSITYKSSSVAATCKLVGILLFKLIDIIIITNSEPSLTGLV